MHVSFQSGTSLCYVYLLIMFYVFYVFIRFLDTISDPVFLFVYICWIEI